METIEDSGGWASGDPSYTVSPTSDPVTPSPDHPVSVTPIGGGDYATVNHRSPPPLPSTPPPLTHPHYSTIKQIDDDGNPKSTSDPDDIMVLESGPDEDVLLGKDQLRESCDELDAHRDPPNGDIKRETISAKNSEILHQFQEPESDCGVDCLYYTVTCCECSIM